MNNLLFKEERKSEEKLIETDTASTITNAEAYFTRELKTLNYPSKSYCVAIIYAHLIAFYFHESFWELLADEDLLNGNDDYFVPYNQNKEIYDEILVAIKFNELDFRLNLRLSQVEATFRYFTEEFSVDPGKYITSL